MQTYALTAMGMVNALGEDLDSIYQRLIAGETHHLSAHVLRTIGETVPVGKVHGKLPTMPEAFIKYSCRNHRLALMAFRQIEKDVQAVLEKYGPLRVGVVLGSSTSGLDASEAAYFTWKKTGNIPSSYDFSHQHDMGSISKCIAEISGARGPSYTVSTACSSSAKVFAVSKGLLDLGICDAVITGGADALCNLTLDGFESLGSLSRSVSNPMSSNRDGLNIGEGAALFILSKEEDAVQLFGVGESCDAYHMSAPHPEGIGAQAAMEAALADAQLKPDQIGYLNMHGTGTPLNDMMEGKAVERVLGQVACSSTKPMVGHSLGVAGAMEVGFCWLVLNNAEQGRLKLPPHIWDGSLDSRIPPLNLVEKNGAAPTVLGQYLMSNSFAFGGNNCSVIIGKP